MAKKKILIVDDDNTTATVMQLYLENFGFSVPAIAKSASDAISKTKKRKPDLVLMDIRLGKGLDGIDAAEVIIGKLGIAVVYITAYTDEETLERAKRANPSGFINKPLRETDLKTTLRFALDKRQRKTKRAARGPSVALSLQETYNLSKAEAKVVAALLDNPDIEHTAGVFNLSIYTVRTHLKHVYRKTNTNRQSALLHKIVTGPMASIVNP